MKIPPVTSLEAETLALDALTYIARSPEDLGRFLTLSGVLPADLRARADDRDLLAAVLDFVLADDKRAKGFCEAFASEPLRLQAARAALVEP